MLPNQPTSAGIRKEILVSEREKYPVVERPTTPEVPPEIEKVEVVTGAEITLPQPVTDDSGQPLVSPAAPQQVVINLPLDDQKIKLGLHYKITDSFRWLTELTRRLVKVFGGKFRYKLR